MDVNGISYRFIKIKFALVFFCFTLLTGCREAGEIENLQVNYANDKAVGVSFTSSTDVEKLRFFIGEESQTSVIGVIVSADDKHTFTPAIPFTAGQTYSIRKSDTVVIETFYIDNTSKSAPPELLAIYPTRDSVPENLLKMYLQFSRPMQVVGSVSDFITVFNDTDEVEVEPFLELETDLWNQDHTLLTLWFDPGRIKTDLIPNREKGMPLQAGKEYTITIHNTWKGENGSPLISTYQKELFVQKRDDQKPRPRDWKMTISENDPDKALLIDFGEPLDAFLPMETIKVYDLNGSEVDGDFKWERGETILRFVPAETWSAPEYKLAARSTLEDLAGNNLNRLFDTNVKEGSTASGSESQQSIRFKLD